MPASNYGYINGRIRTMRTELLDDRVVDEALGTSSYQEYLRVLSESSLREDLGDATAQNAGLRELDAALSQNYLRSVQHLRQVAVGQQQAGRDLDALIMRLDLTNLKTLVRGVQAGRSADDIVGGLIPAGSVAWPVMQAAANSSDLTSLAQTLAVGGGRLGAVLRQAVAAGVNDPLELEVALDQGYYRTVISGLRGTKVYSYFTREIDVRNLLTALQLRGSGAGARYFVPGGRDVSEADFLRVAGGDSQIGSATLQPILEAPDLGGAETAARAVLDEAARNLAMSDVLGAGVALDYLRRKEQEIAKLRLIGRGKFYNLPQDQLRRELNSA